MRTLDHTLGTCFGPLLATFYYLRPFVRFSTISTDFGPFFDLTEIDLKLIDYNQLICSKLIVNQLTSKPRIESNPSFHLSFALNSLQLCPFGSLHQ
jgi:hypothetical protein